MTLFEITNSINAACIKTDANSVLDNAEAIDKRVEKRNAPLKMIKPRTTFRRSKKPSTKLTSKSNS